MREPAVAGPLPRAGGHFCEHGNLRHACAKCRDARRAKYRNVQRKEYGPPVKPGQKVPHRPWTTKDTLGPDQVQAVSAVQRRGGGVIRIPAHRGIPRVALALVRAFRHEAEGIVLLVPSDRAVEGWISLLTDRLHVPTEEIDASGRQIKDWSRPPPIRILSPVGASRNRSGLRQHAQRHVLIVDSPDRSSYEQTVDILGARFHRKCGLVAARFGRAPPAAWPMLDALGGIVYEERLEDAIRSGELRAFDHHVLVPGLRQQGRDAAGTLLEKIRERTGRGAKAIVVVDDTSTGRALEEAAARLGMEPRFVGGAASPGLAERVAAAIKGGNARLLVVTPDAPKVDAGAFDHVCFFGHDLGADAAQQMVLAQCMAALGGSTHGRFHVWDVLPDAAPEDPRAAHRLYRRARALAAAAGSVLPAVPWLARFGEVPTLPAPFLERVRRAARDGWDAVLALLPDAAEAIAAVVPDTAEGTRDDVDGSAAAAEPSAVAQEDLEAQEDPLAAYPLDPTAAAAAALVDAFVAFGLELDRIVSLGPAPLGDPLSAPGTERSTGSEPSDGTAAALLGPLNAYESLVHLALVDEDAARAFAALLDKDVGAFLAAHAASPLLHHLVPDPRRLALVTVTQLRDDPAPARDPTDPRGVADRIARRGARSPALEDREPARPDAPLSPQIHLERLTAGLAAERALDVQESVEEIARLTAAERQRIGRTLLGLELIGKERRGNGLVLRYALPSGARGKTARPSLPYTELSNGSLVRISSGDEYDPVAQGTVADVREHVVEVLVEEDKERRAPGKDARIDLVGNPRVYDVLASAVRRVYGAGGLSATSGEDGLRGMLLESTPGEVTGAGRGDVPSLRFFSPQLNLPQQRAVLRAFANPRLALVHGPPGTGKTTTLVELVQQEVAAGHRVLVTADSNAAVDNIMEAYVRSGGVGVRTGPLPSLTRPFLARLHIDRLRERAPGVPWLERVPVVFSTHVSSGSLPDPLRFDVVVQDEASQATEPATCVSLSLAPKLVLAGDHLQLPPVVRSHDAERAGLALSLFERLFRVYGESHGDLLSVQYRMHEEIAAWSNARFYGDRIETAVDPAPVPAMVDLGLAPSGHRAVFQDVSGVETRRRTSKERGAEAAWILERVEALVSGGVRPDHVAVIAAYRAQVRLLRRMFLDAGVPEGVQVGTIDAFQGSERDIVFVSLVRSNEAGEVGFVREPRRLNVAMTRARRHLVVVGDERTLRGEPILDDLLSRLHHIDVGGADSGHGSGRRNGARGGGHGNRSRAGGRGGTTDSKRA